MERERGLCWCGCGNPAPIAKSHHKSRGDVKGQPKKFIFGHAPKKPATKSYRSVRGKRIHVLRAERALGKTLPPGAVVHHGDGSRSDDAPLVICENQGYHRFLHVRMRVKAACGNPNTDALCGHCRRTKPFALFGSDKSSSKWLGLYRWCRACRNAAQLRRYHAKKRSAA